MERSLLFFGILYHEDIEERVKRRLSEKFGNIVLESAVIPFDFSAYYDKEMGEGLLREWVLFDTPIKQEKIANIKNTTRVIEREFSIDGNRRINIDPGYITLSKVVLATTKDCAHRIYLKDDIFAEVTLMFYKGKWQAQQWTYPDYRSDAAMEFFERCRKVMLYKTER